MSRPAPVPAAFRQVRLSSACLVHRKYELAAVHKAINLKSQYENTANSTSVLRLTLTVRHRMQLQIMKSTLFPILFLAVCLSGCIQRSSVEQRVVELPAGSS